MGSIADTLKSRGVVENAYEADPVPGIPSPTPSDEVNETPFQFPGLNLDWLLKETGPGSIDDYVDHPLNIFKSKGLAQMLRGVVGMIGSELRFAILDIVLGGMQFMKERSGASAAADIHRDT